MLRHGLSRRRAGSGIGAALFDLIRLLHNGAARAAERDAAVSEEAALNAIVLADLSAAIRGITRAADNVQQTRDNPRIGVAEFLGVQTADIAAAETAAETALMSFMHPNRPFFHSWLDIVRG